MKNHLQVFSSTGKRIPLKFATEKVPAGFPSPASSYEETELDINDIVVTNPDSTFFIKVTGDSMIDEGIKPGTILVVDKSIEAKHDHIVIAVVDNEFTVKKLYNTNGVVKLIPANPQYPEIKFKDEQELRIWGVVTYAICKHF